MTLMCRSTSLQDECEQIGDLITKILGWYSWVQAIDEGDSDILDDLTSAVCIYPFNQTFFLAKHA